MIKKILIILVLLIISTDIRAEGYMCYYGMSNEDFKSENEEVREYFFNFIILRKDNQFYEVNDWSNAYDLRLLDRLEIIFENDKVIHLYSNDTDSSMYSMVIDKNNKYFTHSLTTSYGLLGGFDGRCEFISEDEVWKFE
jgi:hypothetical protein